MSVRRRGEGKSAIMQWNDAYVCRGEVQVTVASEKNVSHGIRPILDVGIKIIGVGRWGGFRGEEHV